MKTREQKLYASMRQAAPREWWVQRIENILLDGMPDVFVSNWPKRQIWIELKAPIAPVRESTRLLGDKGLSQDQINWHLKADSLMIPCYTLIRDSNRELYLIPSSAAAIINELPRHRLRAIRLADSWRGIFDVLEAE